MPYPQLHPQVAHKTRRAIHKLSTGAGDNLLGDCRVRCFSLRMDFITFEHALIAALVTSLVFVTRLSFRLLGSSPDLDVRLTIRRGKKRRDK